MSFLVTIDANAGSAMTAISGVESGLARVTDGSARASESVDRMTKSMSGGAARSVSDLSRLDALIAKTNAELKSSASIADTAKPAANAFAGLVDVLAREADVLERIKGPMREYTADMKALDTLLASGKINAAEYANEFDRLNKKVGAMHGPAAPTPGPSRVPSPGGAGSQELKAGLESLAPALGATGELLTGLATKSHIAGAAMAALAMEVVHLGNEYIELSNKAQKLTEKGGDVNATLATQLTLAGQLHSGLDATIEIYDAVRDGTDELNLSQRQQLDLTREIGASVVASGKSLEAAGGLMSKLTFAFSSGTISGRELKGIMKEFPDIGAGFAEAMGHSRTELIAMANRGQITASMLIDAFGKIGPEMEEKVGKRAQTTGQIWQRFTDTLTLSVGKFAESTGIFTLLGAVLDGVAKAIGFVVDVIDLALGPLKDLLSTLHPLIDGFKTAVGAVFDFGFEVGHLMSRMSPLASIEEEFVARQYRIAHAYNQRMEVLKLLGVEEEKNAHVAQVAAAAKQAGIDVGPFDAQTANRLAELRLTLSQIGVQMPDAFDKAHSKATLLTAELDKLAESKAAAEQAEEVKRLAKEMSNTNDIVDAQLKKWRDIGDKIRETRDALKHWEALTPAGVPKSQEQRDLQRQLRDLGLEKDLTQYGAQVLDLKKKHEQYGDSLRDLERAHKDGIVTGEAYRQEYNKLVTALNDGRLPETIKLWEAIHGPQEQFQRDTRALTALLNSGRITLDEYTAQLHKLQDAFSGPEMRTLFDLTEHATKPGVTAMNDIDRDIADRVQREQDALDQAREHEVAGLEASIAAFDKRNASLGESLRLVDPLAYAEKKYAETLDAQKRMLDQIHGPYQAYVDSLRTAGELLENGTISAEQYTKSIDASRAAFLSASDAGKTFSGGLELGWLKLKTEADSFGATIASTLLGDVGKLTDAFVMMANDGKASFSEMIDSMIQDLEKLILKQAIISLVSSVIGGPALPHAATGGHWTVGGSGGTDSQFVGLMMSPGEHLIAQTPQQHSAANGGGQAQQPIVVPAPVVNNVNVMDPSAVTHVLSTRQGQQAMINMMRKLTTGMKP